MPIHQSNKDELITFNPSVLYWFIGSSTKKSALTSTFLSSPLKPTSSLSHIITSRSSLHPTHCPIPLLPSTNMDRQTRPELEEVPTCDHVQDAAMARPQPPKRCPHVSSGLLPRKKQTFICKIITGPYCLCHPSLPPRVCRNGTDRPQQLAPALGAPFPADIQNTEPLLSLNVVS